MLLYKISFLSVNKNNINVKNNNVDAKSNSKITYRHN